MAMRINHNISSLNTQRQLEVVGRAQSKTLEKLSSGLKVNTGADGPAVLAISERLRTQTVGLKQAIDNSETNISLVQSTEGALNEVSRILTSARQLAIHAANEGVNDEVMMQADQEEIDNALDTIDRIAKHTQFGTKNLLDGSRGSSGITNGKNLEFVGATEHTKTSSVQGYKIDIDTASTRTEFKGLIGLNQQIIDARERITVSEGGKTLTFVTEAGQSVESNLNLLNDRIKEAGLNLDLIRDDPSTGPGVIHLRHKEYGSEYAFAVSATTAGIAGQNANEMISATLGKDVSGTINGEETIGRGQVLTGRETSKNTSGLAIRYTGAEPNPPGQFAGTVTVFNNSLIFQIGGNVGQTTSISLKNMGTRSLATGIKNESGFTSLRDIDVRSAQSAQDAQKLLDDALVQVASTRASLGAFQKNNLQSNLNSLRNSFENLTNAESVLRDADMAEEMAEFTKHQIMMQSGTAMLAQANQVPQATLALLG